MVAVEAADDKGHQDMFWCTEHECVAHFPSWLAKQAALIRWSSDCKSSYVAGIIIWYAKPLLYVCVLDSLVRQAEALVSKVLHLGHPLLTTWCWLSSAFMQHPCGIGIYTQQLICIPDALDSFSRSGLVPSEVPSVGNACVSTWLTISYRRAYIQFSDVSQPQYYTVSIFLS